MLTFKTARIIVSGIIFGTYTVIAYNYINRWLVRNTRTCSKLDMGYHTTTRQKDEDPHWSTTVESPRSLKNNVKNVEECAECDPPPTSSQVCQTSQEKQQESTGTASAEDETQYEYCTTKLLINTNACT